MKVLKKGDKGKNVGAFQAALNKAGAKPPLDTDEIFGKLTEAATKKFQSRNKLDVTGVADEATLFQLKIGSKPKTDEKAAGKAIDNLEENIQALESYLKDSESSAATIQSMIKFLKKTEGNVSATRKAASATLAAFRPLFAELSSLRLEYERVKTTHLARAAAILLRIGEIEKEQDRLKAAYNKGSQAWDKDAARAAGMMAAFESG